MSSDGNGTQGFRPNRIGVVGAGPVGCVVAAHLAHAGHEVVLCDVVPALLAPAMEPGIRVEGVGTEAVVGRVARTVQTVDEFAADPPELIFITVKATALPLIASAIEAFHRPGVCVVSWQNGIDTEVVLAEHIPARWVYRAVVNLGVGAAGAGPGAPGVSPPAPLVAGTGRGVSGGGRGHLRPAHRGRPAHPPGREDRR